MKRLKKLKPNEYSGVIVLTMNGEANIFINQAAFVKHVYSCCELLLEDPDATVATEEEMIEWFLESSDGIIFQNCKINQ